MVTSVNCQTGGQPRPSNRGGVWSLLSPTARGCLFTFNKFVQCRDSGIKFGWMPALRAPANRGL